MSKSRYTDADLDELRRRAKAPRPFGIEPLDGLFGYGKHDPNYRQTSEEKLIAEAKAAVSLREAQKPMSERSWFERLLYRLFSP